MLRIGIGGLLQCRNLTIQLFLGLVLAPFTRDPLHTFRGEHGLGKCVVISFSSSRFHLKATGVKMLGAVV